MAASGIEFHRRWIEQCEAAQRIKQWFGLSNALEYLVGEKLLHFADSKHHPDFAQELPYFVNEIKRVFSLAEVGNYAVTLSVPSRSVCPSELLSAQFHRCPGISIKAQGSVQESVVAPFPTLPHCMHLGPLRGGGIAIARYDLGLY
jgi:hypothetical protein